MDWIDISLLVAAAFFTSALTAVAGAGGGTILIALMLLFMPPAAAIPAHGVVQLASNTWRVWLFRRHMAWPLIIRFSLLMPFGTALGLWLFQGMSKELVQILIGFFVLLTLFLRHLKRFAPKEFPLWAFIPLGFVTGALNMERRMSSARWASSASSATCSRSPPSR
ncbi:MAG: sulfite exporter TauE/SafE family protein [Burkholderiales bacterium]|nr:sulfite exporter TauE/SafE family protein [Burkholderiales bacterium]